MRKVLSGIVVALLVMSLAALPTRAQENATSAETTTEQTTPETVPGLTTLVLLMGLGAVALVGGSTFIQERARRQQNPHP